ncbi:hypothetical protein K8353_38805 [Burkholderia contaminans]|nr:hypothetical protein [Burkholderia contaminans]
MGPTTDPNKVNSGGQAAHICAAAPGPGAARYDPNMTPDERSSIDNGIWLCLLCARMIDLDAAKYPVELLKRWKQEAEDAAAAEHGQTPISPREFALMKAALYKNPVGRSVSSALAEMACLSVNELEQRDPRFAVKVEYVAGVTHIILHAKEPVEIRATVAADFLSEFHSQMSALVAHGQTVEFHTSRVRLTGSTLLEDVTEQDGIIKFETRLRRRAIVKILLLHPETAVVFALDDFIGEVVGGTQSLTFDGEIFEGLYGLRFQFDYVNRGKSSDVKFEFALAYDQWIGHNVSDLPYFDKLFRFLDALKNGWTVNWSLEVEGMTILSGRGTDLGASKEFREEYFKISYLRSIRDLLALWTLKLPMTEAPLSWEEVSKLLKLWSLLCEFPKRRGAKMKPRHIVVKPQNPAEVDGLRAAVKSGQPMPVFLDQNFSESFNILGVPVSVRPLRIHYSAVSLRFNGLHSSIRQNRPATLTMIPMPDCEIRIEPKDSGDAVVVGVVDATDVEMGSPADA